MQDWIGKLFEDPDLTRMGHGQSLADLNLGLGWIYYALARSLCPTRAVVIGSYRGFVPLVLGKAMQDNGNGEVIFLDPSLVDDFWAEPARVQAHFEGYGVRNIRHFRATTQEFVGSSAYHELAGVGILFVDGYHTAEQAQFDHEAFSPKMTESGVALFHDSARERLSRIYGVDRAYTHTVCRYIDRLRSKPGYEVLTLGVADGLAVVRRCSHNGLL